LSQIFEVRQGAIMRPSSATLPPRQIISPNPGTDLRTRVSVMIGLWLWHALGFLQVRSLGSTRCAAPHAALRSAVPTCPTCVTAVCRPAPAHRVPTRRPPRHWTVAGCRRRLPKRSRRTRISPGHARPGPVREGHGLNAALAKRRRRGGRGENSGSAAGKIPKL